MILVSLGANLPSPVGSPAQTICAALSAIAAHGPEPIAISFFYETPAWPDPSDPPFVNAVVQLHTSLMPQALLSLLHKTETAFGRTRSTRNAPRSLDLDLLDYHGRVDAGPPILPHPAISERAFVLVPLADVAPDWRHPVTTKSLADLLDALPQQSRLHIRRLPQITA